MASTEMESTSDQAPSHSEVAVPSRHPHPVYNPDAPSEAWGWHGQWADFAPRGRNILLGIGTLVMFAMLIGNHQSRVEDYWLVAIGIGLGVWTVISYLGERKRRRLR